jgi:hypothetical protein
MSAVSEWIVREYFEALGFLVRQPVKYQVVARSKRAEEEIDLVVSNPAANGEPASKRLLWAASDLRHVARAVVSIRGWHTESFTPGVLEMSPEIFRFTEDEVVRIARRLLGDGPIARILCVPTLPPPGAALDKAREMLSARGVDGVLSFRTILLELTARVDVNRHYEKSDLLQVLRLLKNYGLLQTPQLPLFARRAHPAGTRRPGAGDRPPTDAGDAAGAKA